jgi:hypothetical protein
MALAAFIPVLGPIVDKLLDLIPDPTARARAEEEYRKALLAAAIRETAENREINKAEAAHRSIFVAGWRPFFGWMSGFLVLYAYFIRPLLVWALLVWAPDQAGKLPEFPLEYVWELIFGLLGIGGLRTLEKVKGKAR